MDRNLLNISGMVAFILGIVSCCTIVGIIVGIPMIIGGNKLREISKMNDEEIEKSMDTLLIWTIVLLFICPIAGILSIICYFTYKNPLTFGYRSNSSKYDDLEKINKLYKDKVITKEEFEAEKSRILND